MPRLQTQPSAQTHASIPVSLLTPSPCPVECAHHGESKFHHRLRSFRKTSIPPPPPWCVPGIHGNRIWQKWWSITSYIRLYRKDTVVSTSLTLSHSPSLPHVLLVHLLKERPASTRHETLRTGPQDKDLKPPTHPLMSAQPLEPQPLAPVEPLDNSSPGQFGTSWDLEPKSAGLLLDSLLSETVITSVCCGKLLSFEGICYPAVNKYTGVLLVFPLWAPRNALGGRMAYTSPSRTFRDLYSIEGNPLLLLLLSCQVVTGSLQSHGL